MIVVKIELWKHGNPDDVTELHRVTIANNLTAKRRPAWGNYDVTLDGEPIKQVDGHYRERGVIPLVRRALFGMRA